MLPKNKISTVVVMATCNPSEVILDQIDAIHWTCKESHFVVVVDDGGGLDLPCVVLRSNSKFKKPGSVGFKVNEGIKWAVQNLDFEMVMVLDDDALPIGKGLDVWALEIFRRNPNVGLIGTKDDVKACSLYNDPQKVDLMRLQMSKWHPIKDWVHPKEVVFYAVNFQSRGLVEKLNQLGFLDIEKELWPTPCETYQSWVTTLVGYDLYFWGRYPDELKPPLYSMHHGSVKPEDPRQIDPNFLVHHSIRQVTGVDEWTIRDFYKKKRKQNQILLF